MQANNKQVVTQLKQKEENEDKERNEIRVVQRNSCNHRASKQPYKEGFRARTERECTKRNRTSFVEIVTSANASLQRLWLKAR